MGVVPDPGAAPAPMDQLFEQTYQELRKLAHARLRRSEKITLLDTTALVHELYLRVPREGGRQFPNDRAFLGYASQVMRSVAVDMIRRRRTLRRGHGAVHESLVDSDEATDDLPVLAAPAEAETLQTEEEILQLSAAIDRLAELEPRLAQVVEMRYFGGCTEAEIARVLGVADRTVRRDWQRARVLLRAALGSL